MSTSDHMLGRAIWDKLSECIFENFEIARVKPGNFKIFENYEGGLSQKSPEPNMWLLVNHTKPTKTLYVSKLMSVLSPYDYSLVSILSFITQLIVI